MNPNELPKGWLTPEEDALVPSRELWQNPLDPISHYYRWIWEYLAYLPLLCDLRRDGTVLDLGCGHGRIAHGLLSYLRHPGSYVGLDVDRSQIEVGRRLIEPRAANFRFVHADVYNRQTNPAGSLQARDFTFPFENSTFDVIFAASLFTHLLPDEMRNYMVQSARVLRPGGKCLFSFFLLDHYGGPGTTISPIYEFPHALAGHPGVAVRDPDHPDVLIGYRRQVIVDAASQAGLTVERLFAGLWSESPGIAVNEQDLLVLGPA